MPAGDTEERTLVDPLDLAAMDLPSGSLGGPVRDAIEGTAGALGPELVGASGEAGTPLPGFSKATVAIVLLEAAERAEGQVHSLADPADERPYETRLWAMAAGWLRSRAAELASGLGPVNLARTSAALTEIAVGWMREARDLYDAGRTVDRYMAAVQGARGALGALAATIGGDRAGLDREVMGRLAGAARGLANAGRLRDDLLELTPSNHPERPTGQSLAQGRYSLPVILSVERDPGLAKSLGGAIPPDELPGLVKRIWNAGGPIGASAQCRNLTESALSTLTDIGAAEIWSSIGARIIEDCDSAVAR
jgi:geranylgeranyl pyrophosphate synthase